MFQCGAYEIIAHDFHAEEQHECPTENCNELCRNSLALRQRSLGLKAFTRQGIEMEKTIKIQMLELLEKIEDELVYLLPSNNRCCLDYQA
jgi:hypothetical protein